MLTQGRRHRGARAIELRDDRFSGGQSLQRILGEQDVLYEFSPPFQVSFRQPRQQQSCCVDGINQSPYPAGFDEGRVAHNARQYIRDVAIRKSDELRDPLRITRVVVLPRAHQYEARQDAVDMRIRRPFGELPARIAGDRPVESAHAPPGECRETVSLPGVDVRCFHERLGPGIASNLREPDDGIALTARPVPAEHSDNRVPTTIRQTDIGIVEERNQDHRRGMHRQLPPRLGAPHDHSLVERGGVPFFERCVAEGECVIPPRRLNGEEGGLLFQQLECPLLFLVTACGVELRRNLNSRTSEESLPPRCQCPHVGGMLAKSFGYPVVDDGQ